MFFLLIAISQFIPILKVGLLFSIISPLGLVLFLTLCKEAYEDFKRYIRDKEANSAKYKYLNFFYYTNIQLKKCLSDIDKNLISIIKKIILVF